MAWTSAGTGASPDKLAGPTRAQNCQNERNFMSKILSGTDHHEAAANHHEQAAWHHREAARNYAEKDHALAAHQALIAHGRTQQAIRHANEATKYHVEHHGKALPQ
jgi:hypothetical protein